MMSYICILFKSSNTNNLFCLTCQLSSDSLEWQLPELLNQRSKLGAADQFMFTIVQLIH